MRNKLKVTISDAGMAKLRLEKRDSYGRLVETVHFTLTKQALEEGLDKATIEIPWRQVSGRTTPDGIIDRL